MFFLFANTRTRRASGRSFVSLSRITRTRRSRFRFPAVFRSHSIREKLHSSVDSTTYPSPDDARRDEISLSAEVLRLSQFHAISGDTVPILVPCFPFIDLLYACTFFLRRFYLRHRCRLFVILFFLSLFLPLLSPSPSRTARRVALFAHQDCFPLRARSHPSSEAAKSRHLLRSLSSDSMATVVPFNIDEGVVVAGPTRCRFTMYILTCQHSISYYL